MFLIILSCQIKTKKRRKKNYMLAPKNKNCILSAHFIKLTLMIAPILMTAAFCIDYDGSEQKHFFDDAFSSVRTTAQSIKNPKEEKKNSNDGKEFMRFFYEFRRRIQLLSSDEFICFGLQ